MSKLGERLIEAAKEAVAIVRGANVYYCKHCGDSVLRDSDKQWVKSYCDKAGKTVHLIKKEIPR